MLADLRSNVVIYIELLSKEIILPCIHEVLAMKELFFSNSKLYGVMQNQTKLAQFSLS